MAEISGTGGRPQLGAFLASRQYDLETGFSRLRENANFTPMFLDDIVADIQTQPGSLADRLGGNERTKDF